MMLFAQCAVALALGPPAEAAAEAGGDGRPGVVEPELEPESAPSASVDASEIGTIAPDKIAELAIEATNAAARAGLDPSCVHVSLVEINPMEILRGVRVSIVTDDFVLRDPQGDLRGPVLRDCIKCSDKELRTLAAEAIQIAIERHKAWVDQQAQEPAPEPVVELTDPVVLPVVDDPRAPTGALLGVGVSAVVLGAAALTTGAVFAAMEPAPFPNRVQKHLLRDLRPPGYLLLGSGAVVAAAGAIMIGVHARRSSKSNKGAHKTTDSPAVTIVPSSSRGQWHLSLVGRF